ncbi:hypothetical protein ILYODFUR_030924 [Ilyodon furcidens]|uniref:Uncharacterized protein n=1 Tax=Ilyodon furcidens TaxID=33524 RepID=A0ABV0UMA0_9TELE
MTHIQLSPVQSIPSSGDSGDLQDTGIILEGPPRIRQRLDEEAKQEHYYGEIKWIPSPEDHNFLEMVCQIKNGCHLKDPFLNRNLEGHL